LAIDYRYAGKSGIGTYIEGVVEELICTYPQHEFLIIQQHSNTIDIDFHNVKKVAVDIKPFSPKELFCFPVSAINQCDAFLTPYINIPGGIKVPVYSTIHDVLFFDVNGLTSHIGKTIRKAFYNRAINLSKIIFTVSQFSKNRTLHHFPTNKDIEVVYNGVPKEFEMYLPKQLQKQDYFIYVGNIKRHKGLSTLVEAFGKAQLRGLKSKLIIVGNYENFRTSDNKLIGLIDKNKNIEFTGWVTNERLVSLVADAKALVQPSLYEGFGIPPLEAICLGTDVLLSDIPVFKELYHELSDCFFRVEDSEDLANRLLNYIPNPKLNEYRSIFGSPA